MHPVSAADAEAPADRASCYHCGLDVPSGTALFVEIDGVRRAMCCAGCQAVAQAIVANQLTEYYRHRDSLPDRPREAVPDALRELGLFDDPAVQKDFVRPVGEHEREASLILEGITCAACVWLNEKHVAHQDGVTGVQINYATRRARVRWDARRIKLSDILGAIAAIGYRAYPYDAARSEQIAQRERRTALWRLFVAGFGMMQVMMYAVPAYLAEDGTMSQDIERLLRWASLILTVPVVLYSAAPFFRNAWRDLRLKSVGMDVPVALGVGVAFGASVWATVASGGEVYFDSVTMFVFLLLCGRYLEMMARQKAVRSVEDLGRVLPAFALRLADAAAEPERVPVGTLAVNDLVLVPPGEVFPADGVIADGSTSADESLLTGESQPVPKQVGDEVTGGSVNRSSPVQVHVWRVGDETRLAAIQRLMERASTEKPRVVETADRVAAHFVAALLIIAALTAGAWYLVDPARALWVSVSVLVVSCPCALSLATPVALTVATGTMSREGLLVTRGHAIETLARATHFVFDKTGTLTRGLLRLGDVVLLGSRDDRQALHIAAALERGSEHAVGAGFRNAAPQDEQAVTATGIRSVTGLGVEGRIDGSLHRAGRIEFVAEIAGDLPRERVAGIGLETGSWVGLGGEGGWVALFRFDDAIRPQAADLVRMLRQGGYDVSILSGDTPGAVRRVADELGVEDAHGALSPQEKHRFVASLQQAGEVVAAVGDGVNDAPILAQAQVSVAMGGGTDLARTQGDLILLSGNLLHLAAGVSTARKALSVIRQNLAWAFAYNIVAIPAAMLGWVTPWMAGIGMSASSLLVVLNALRLQRPRPARLPVRHAPGGAA